jgi:hypothetical protein
LLQDLTRTYRFLNGHISEEVRLELLQLADVPIFLNINDPQNTPHDSWIWCTANQLLLDIDEDSTTRNIFYVRPYLEEFRTLLIAAGVSSIIAAPRFNPDLTSAEQKLDSLCQAFQTMRQGNTLTDVTIKSTVEPNEEGAVAHRAFLAASSEFFKDLFTGGFRESLSINGDTVEISVQHTLHTIKIVLDYLYTGELCEMNQSWEDCEKMLDIIELAAYWRLAELVLILESQLLGCLNIDTYNASM